MKIVYIYEHLSHVTIDVEFKYISLDVTDNIPVHFLSIASDHSFSLLFVMIWKVLVFYKSFMSKVTHANLILPSSFPNLSSLFFAWFSNLHFILCAKVHWFLCSVTFLIVSIYLTAVLGFMCGHLLFRSSSPHLCISGHFNSRWNSLSSCAHSRHLPLFPFHQPQSP
jgi:hypothetical protein